MKKYLLISLIITATAINFFTYPSFAADKEPFTLSTSAFLDDGILPVLYTCDGKDISPQFSWKNLPAKTTSLVMILVDPDAPKGPFYHWVLINISPSTKELAEGITTPPGAMLGMNSFGKTTYQGPCPPKGSTHSYIFTLYALDKKLNLTTDKADGATVLAQMKNHILGQTKLITVYSRWLK